MWRVAWRPTNSSVYSAAAFALTSSLDPPPRSMHIYIYILYFSIGESFFPREVPPARRGGGGGHGTLLRHGKRTRLGDLLDAGMEGLRLLPNPLRHASAKKKLGWERKEISSAVILLVMPVP